MALDFHKLDSGEYLFGIEQELKFLSVIFDEFYNWTGLSIDQYGHTKLSVENLETIVQIINKHIEQIDLNKNKEATSSILEFKGILKYLINHNVNLKIVGD